MTNRDEDALWRSIVENYGERAELDDDIDPPSAAGATDVGETTGEPGDVFDTEDTDPQPSDELSHVDDEPRFVPPVPPPLPTTTRTRRAAWFGLIGAPILFLLTAFTGGTLGGTVALTLVTVFVASLAYLVFTMPQEPRDPWDNGARV